LNFNRDSIKLLLAIAGSIAGVAVIFSVGVIIFLLAVEDTSPPVVARGDVIGNLTAVNTGDIYEFVAMEVERPDDTDDGTLFRPPARTNFLLVGLDNQLLADAIMVGTFYRDSGDIHLMSVPRDMFVRIPPHRLAQMNEAGFRPPSTLKINEMRAHGGRAQGLHFLKAQLGEMFGVDFNFYVEVELAAFKRVVDAIGGVEMYIPRPLFYESPNQNPPLLIDVPEGLQMLDGNMAEGVVRYRLWPMGDLHRNNMQMEFMTLLIQQTLTREALLNNPLEMINIVLTEVRTDIGLYAGRYLPYVENVNADSVTTFVMPGTIGYVGNREFFIPDTAKMPTTINEVFYAMQKVAEDND